MKLRASVKESPQPSENTMIVEFEGDKKRQHFELKCTFNPYSHGIRKWDVIFVWVKWESEIFEDTITGKKSYFTHLVCDKYKEYTSPY